MTCVFETRYIICLIKFLRENLINFNKLPELSWRRFKTQTDFYTQPLKIITLKSKCDIFLFGIQNRNNESHIKCTFINYVWAFALDADLELKRTRGNLLRADDLNANLTEGFILVIIRGSCDTFLNIMRL